MTQVIMGVPSTRTDWKTPLEDLEHDGKAWRAIHGHKHTATYVRARTYPATHKRFGVTRKSKIPNAVTLDWWIIGDTHIDIPRYIAGASMITRRQRGDWCMPPKSYPNAVGKLAGETLYYNRWDVLQEECRILYRGRINSRALSINMQRSKDILQWSPFSWIRRVMGMSQAWDVNYRHEGTMIYAVICNTTGKVYVGQTGKQCTIPHPEV